MSRILKGHKLKHCLWLENESVGLESSSNLSRSRVGILTKIAVHSVRSTCCLLYLADLAVGKYIDESGSRSINYTDIDYHIYSDGARSYLVSNLFLDIP
jgi:hypothetical protein